MPAPPARHRAASFTATLTAALACENLAFTTFAIMTRASLTPGGATICDISETLNLSYHAVLHQAHRAPYFEFDRSAGRVRLVLNEAGLRKMTRIEQRLARKPFPRGRAGTRAPIATRDVQALEPAASVTPCQPSGTTGGA